MTTREVICLLDAWCKCPVELGSIVDSYLSGYFTTVLAPPYIEIIARRASEHDPSDIRYLVLFEHRLHVQNGPLLSMVSAPHCELPSPYGVVSVHRAYPDTTGAGGPYCIEYHIPGSFLIGTMTINSLGEDGHPPSLSFTDDPAASCDNPGWVSCPNSAECRWHAGWLTDERWLHPLLVRYSDMDAYIWLAPDGSFVIHHLAPSDNGQSLTCIWCDGHNLIHEERTDIPEDCYLATPLLTCVVPVCVVESERVSSKYWRYVMGV